MKRENPDHIDNILWFIALVMITLIVLNLKK